MGFKVDREAVATLVLPQLWAMSMGPRKFLLHVPTPQIILNVYDSPERRAVPTFYGRHQAIR